MLRSLLDRLAATNTFDESPGRMQSLGRAFKIALYVAAPIVLLLALQWAADAFLAAPGTLFLIWMAAAALGAFVFRRGGFHALVFFGAVIFFFYPIRLIFAGSPVYAILYVALTGFLEWRIITKKRSWVGAGYVFIFLTFAFILTGEIVNTIFTSDRVNNPQGMKGIRHIDGPAVIPGTDKTIDLKGKAAFNILLSTNGKRLYASYNSPGAKGVAAFSLSNGHENIYRAIGHSGVRLIQINPDTGTIFAGDIDKGTLYELSYEDLGTNKEYALTRKPFPCAVVDVPGNQVFVPDMRAQTLKVFNLGNLSRPWAKIPSGGLGFKLFPDVNANMIPGTWSLNQMIQDPGRRRIFMTYSMNRNLVTVDMDAYRVVKIDRGPYPGAATTGPAPGMGLLFMAKPLGYIEYYDTNNLRLKRRLARRGGYRALDFDPVRNRIVAANYYSGVVHFIDIATGRDMARRNVCRRITHLAVSPINGNVYVNCEKGLFELDPVDAGVPAAAADDLNGL